MRQIRSDKGDKVTSTEWAPPCRIKQISNHPAIARGVRKPGHTRRIRREREEALRLHPMHVRTIGVESRKDVMQHRAMEMTVADERGGLLGSYGRAYPIRAHLGTQP
ncbi:hypothetical protein A0H81_05960 [Grifola frondosa]|uniref:Uncharacterized protein n=1 Tax=Grifola frondosa TaxID=5627 RepID=A0A1C7M9X4_GRIFR|nr:hypothetical protein A0H81_05960 [Grifola frondosa]